MLFSAAEAVRAEMAASEGGGREMKPEEGLEVEADDDDDDDEGERRPPPPRPLPPPPRLPPPRLSLPPLSTSVDVDIARTSRHGAGVRGEAGFATAEKEQEEKEARRMAPSRERESIRFFRNRVKTLRGRDFEKNIF